MTTYFYGSPEIQAAAPPPEGIQTLYLMNPNYLSYPDTPQQQTSNILFFNPPSNALNPTSIPHAPPQNHPLLGVPLPSANSDDPSRHHGIGILNFQNNMWGSLDQSSAGIGSTVVSVAGQDVRSQTQQGLSLSLSSRQRSIGGEHEIQQHAHGTGGDDMRVWRELSPPSVSVASNGIFGSKYLRVIQELLDEVVNIGKEIKTSSDPTEVANKESVAQDGSTAAAGGGGDGNSKRAQELTTAQRQELQMKKAKLVSMIDEVEQRYKQYHHQMQLVVSSFEQAAGLGSAKSYTALALQTISKQFRCLKDAISSQIKATNESLGDEDCSGVKIEGSRLKYVDHHLRQQRAIQQLGMMQHNPWRPQRGLPERAVSVLRAWLFEHFLHPYPKDSDKVILAKQAGLTRSQVSNWFINARVRLWKPMVEEMYVEEMKEQEKNGSANHASASNNEQHNKHGSTSNTESSLGAKARQSEPEKLKISQNPNSSPSEFSNSTISTPHVGGPIQPQQGFNIIRSAELEGTSQFSTLKKRPRSNDTMHNSPSSFSLVTNATTDHGGGGFGAYFSPEQLGPRFKGNGNVSLTLGLGENLSFSTNQHNFMSGQNIQLGRLDIGNGITSGTDFCGINNNSQNSHSGTAGLEDIEVQNRKRFVAQLLPDFVA